MLKVRGVCRDVGDRSILANISFSINPGEVLFIRGPSGVGKSLLLRSVACLDPIQGGELLLNDKSPSEVGVPNWRARITYVPQSRTHPQGTPSELYYTAQRFAAQRKRQRGDLPALVHALGLEQLVLNQPWTELSGGQAQRVTLAICLALKPDIILLDEPTSALDHESAIRAEKVLRDSGSALIWVTHDDLQPSRIGGRVLNLPLGNEEFSIWSILIACGLTLVNILISMQLSLGMHKTLLTATLRCILQVTILAYFLTPAFALNRWWFTLIYFVIIVLVSGAETVSRPPAAYEGMLIHVLGSMSGSSALVMVFGISLVMRPSPWYDVKKVLPTVGLLLSNAINGVSLGMSCAIKELTQGKDRLELLLSIGASRREAMKGIIQQSLVEALTPAINTMSVVGLVSIPEFMSGQLASEASPMQAARFQIVIMILSMTCSMLASLAAIICVLLVGIDNNHSVRPERLILRPWDRDSGVAQWVHAQAIKGGKTFVHKWKQIAARIRVSRNSSQRRPRNHSQGSWLIQSPLARRMLGRRGNDDLGGQPFQGIQIASDNDEQDSILSGRFSDAEESGFTTPNQNLLSSSADSSRGFFSPARSHVEGSRSPENGH